MKTLILALGLAIAMPISVFGQSVSPRVMSERCLEEGRMELRRGRTVAAEMAYRKASAMDPSDPMPHYLLANLLARSERHVNAIGEYKTCLRLGPTSSVAGYCKQALGAYKQTSFSETAGPRGEYIPPPPPTHLESAIDVINRQAQCKKIRDQKFASNLSKSTVKGAAWKASDIKLTAESDISHVYSNARTARGKIISTQQLEAEAARIRADADQRARLEHEMAEERADAHAAWMKERHQDIDEVAGNLKEQLTERPSKFGFDLAPTGTGLYVRNYKSSVPKKRLPDPRFSVLRLTEPGIHQDD